MSADKVTILLKRVAIGLAPFCLGGSLLLYKKMQDGLVSHNYFPQAMALLRQDPIACDRLGKPIYNKYIELSDEWNVVRGTNAQLKIPVRGSKNKGTLVMLASRPERDAQDWRIDRLHLNVERYPSLAIYDPQQESGATEQDYT